MRIFRISEAFKQELRQQRKTIFGNKRYWFHIVLWVLVLFFALIQNQDFQKGLRIGMKVNNKRVALDPVSITTTLTLAAITAALMVYGLLLFVIPLARVRRQKRVLWLGLIANGVLFVVTMGVVGIIAGYTAQRNQETASGIMVNLSIMATVSVIIPAYFFAFYYFIDLYDQQRNLTRFQQVFTDKLQAETNFLKTQINPHFLFNTLNNIYSLALRQSDDAPVIARQLKELTQYMLHDCMQDMVPLAGEVNFLKNYVSLEQLRNKQDDVDIQLHVDGDTGDKEIAPLLLVNFIENAFKHGVKSGISHAFVKISLLIMDETLSMEITNSRPSVQETPGLAVKEAGGIGIRNVRRRLEILYPGRHRLRINQSRQEYTVHLNIEL
ncbi:sensor histidine kinase [Taibaiella chishuiensis]|uniref:Histidine kinase n=1 Tax=Taibaiella chishuiensis TaxID=1434707 RepID=A0A2P8CV83_9BACT|nr:histidine kinase [Taibaiella chishuiensis]PSK88866.1 histidine kinase [Taibaiella chishuiensis]